MKNDISFNQRADQYDEGFEGRLSKRFYMDLLNIVKVQDGDSVLDVGCGTGTVLKHLSLKHAIKGYGVDISENMLEQARKKCPEMTFCMGSCNKMSCEDNSMDVITTCMAYHHFSDQEGFRREALRVLKTGGKLYVCDPNFPSLIRGLIHGILKISNTNGHFYPSNVLEHDFMKTGFQFVQLKKDKYVQVLVMQKQ